MNLQRLTNNIIDALWGNSEDDYFDRRENIDKRIKTINFSEFLKRLGIHPDEINFYPGNKSIGCRETAVFICLSKVPPKAKWIKKSDMKSLDKMLPIIIQHMQGNCIDTTMKMTVITDDVSMAEINKWRGNLKNIQQRDKKEVLITYVDPDGKKHDFRESCGLSPF
jgi:hypothetical protein